MDSEDDVLWEFVAKLVLSRDALAGILTGAELDLPQRFSGWEQQHDDVFQMLQSAMPTVRRALRRARAAFERGDARALERALAFLLRVRPPSTVH